MPDGQPVTKPAYQPSRLLASRAHSAMTEADLATQERLAALDMLSAADLGLAPGSDKVWKNRFRSAANYVIPNLFDAGLDPSGLNALEIGCGTGAKSVALAPLFKSYVGVDLFYSSIAFSERAAAKMGVSNTEFHAVTAGAIRDFLASFKTKFDVIFLIAVVEHLTPIERVETLKAAFELLNTGGVIYIGETPNRLSAADHHTFFLPYFDGLPPELAMRVQEHSPRKDYVQRIANAVDPETELYRVGKGVGHQEFELALPQGSRLQDHILLDGFDLGGLNTHALRNYEPLRLEEFSILRADPRTKWQPLPPFFARHLFEGVLSKEPKAGKAFRGTPYFARQARLDGTWYSLSHAPRKEKAIYGFPRLVLNEGQEMIIPMPVNTPGRVLLGVDRESNAGVRLSAPGTDWSIEFHVGDILAAQPPFWHIHAVIGADVQTSFEELRIEKTSGPGELTLFTAGFRPKAEVSLY